LRLPLKGPIVTEGAPFANKLSPCFPCHMAGMKVKEFHSLAVKSVTGIAVAIGLGIGIAAPAFAQPQGVPAPTFASTRNQVSSLPPGTVRYDDLGSPKGGFLLEQRGSMVLLQMDGSGEILTLVPMPGARGDTVFMDYRGRAVLKVTKAGNVVSYLHNEQGAPADPQKGMLPPLSAPAMTAAMDTMRVSAVSELSRLAGHDVTVWGTQSFASTEAFAADALSILVIGVRNANGHAGRAAARIEKVTLRRAKAPRVVLNDGELIIEVNPDDPWGGRVSPDEVTRVLTQSRSAG
jgi:Domain of unknown function (DUF4908)